MNLKKIALALMCILLYCTHYAQEKPKVSVGGALRFNYTMSSWKDGQKERMGDFGFDVFRLNAKANYKKLSLNAEYRFYAQGFGGSMLKHGWLAYQYSPKDRFQLGLVQVPFGITPYNSHSFFFSINYYLGLEDDHDMGLKFEHRGEKFDYAIALFKNAEELRFGNHSDSSNSRYSYDLGTITKPDTEELILRNKEVNQLNGQLSYYLDANKQHKLGVSVSYGGIYNLDTKKMGMHYAYAAHYEMALGQFAAKAQLSAYKYAAKNPKGQATNKIAMTAYGAPYLVAAAARSYTLGLSYTIPIANGLISELKLYNDFGYLDKQDSSFKDTMMNTLGLMITAGQIYTYIDLASGKNHAWLGRNWREAFAEGANDAGWQTRFNINLGYYF